MTKYTIILDTEKNPRDMMRMGMLQIAHEERLKERQLMERRMKAERKAVDEYIKLLSDETVELMSYAVSHGWRSTRGEEGKRMRKKIQSCRKVTKG